MKTLLYIILFAVNLTLINAQFNYTPNKIGNSAHLTGEDYITGEDGVPRMSINIMGHVRYPGAYLVYDGIDILTSLSLAGGPMTGAKLTNVTIISKDGTIQSVNLDKILSDKKKINFKLKPHDTIFIDETFFNYVLTKSNLVSTFLQITNLIIISTNR